ncbi:MAG: DEAD/DEAH box helicase family protein [Bacteroidaceae bacterium]|nr:DEAD/DEAH box helicase family protein [Bacteroidaceae bacterium]
MGFRDLNIKACYESGIEDIIVDFYEPTLSNAVQYDRIAGFFSSSSLAIVSRGLYGFIKNNGRMRLITSPKLSEEDAGVIRQYILGDFSALLRDFNSDIESLQDEIIKNHVKALGWMLSKGMLEIKLAIPVKSDGSLREEDEMDNKALFHQKVGVLRDYEGNELSFSGSINESASAWVYNDEEFKVFKGWMQPNEYFEGDKKRFHELWNGLRENTKVYDLPDAIKQNLIQYSRDFDVETISVKKYLQLRRFKYEKKESKISLFPYQAEALKKWRSNAYRLLFEMATGTGKTRTAIAGIEELKSTSKKFVVIISTPQNTLSMQWRDEIGNLGLMFDSIETIDGTNNKWEQKLMKLLLSNAVGMCNHCAIFTTHATSSSEKFITVMTKYLSHESISLFVGDEVHWLGASKLRKALLPIYIYRIGLSATPSRWFDDEGTNLLIDYFGNDSFEFSIHDALTEVNPLTGKHFLVNYYYDISTVSLNEEETDEYHRITKQLVRLSKQKDNDDDAQERYERLLEKRANIIKNAYAKYEILENILDKLDASGNIQDLIIFVSPKQINHVMEILFYRGVRFHRLTEAEGTRKDRRYGGISEREHIIKLFKEKTYKVLVAIKCLDEGIDIPCASMGILMASSTNPREYVQRIGRIIRQDENKSFAKVYDICVEKIADMDDEEIDLERQVRKKEYARLKEIADNSINPIDVLNKINQLN